MRGHSHYSFLDSTLSPAALVKLAKQHGLPAVALTDTGNLHGAVEFALAAKEAGIKPILGAEFRVEESRCCSMSNRRAAITTFAGCFPAMPSERQMMPMKAGSRRNNAVPFHPGNLDGLN